MSEDEDEDEAEVDDLFLSGGGDDDEPLPDFENIDNLNEEDE